MDANEGSMPAGREDDGQSQCDRKGDHDRQHAERDRNLWKDVPEFLSQHGSAGSSSQA
jgi:hypothetical protein